MNLSQKDNLTDITQSLPATPPPSSSANPGTVVASDGTRVTLGAQGV